MLASSAYRFRIMARSRDEGLENILSSKMCEVWGEGQESCLLLYF
jgi:hypothetical protein